MARLTAGQIYTAARQAGFSAASAVVATAVALAESGGDPAAIGDQSLANSTWGPSIGLWQVRTLKAATGTGGIRDISALTGDVAAQARAALSISGGGSDWNPWSVYTSGAYRQFLGQASTASNGAAEGIPATVAGIPGTAAIGDAVGGIIADSLKPARALALKIAAIGLGLGLVGVGIARTVTTSEVRRQALERRDQARAAALAVL